MFENNSIRIPEWPPGVHDDESSPRRTAASPTRTAPVTSGSTAMCGRIRPPESVRRPAAAAPETPTEETPPEERAPTDEGVPAEFKSALRKADLHDQPTSEYGA